MKKRIIGAVITVMLMIVIAVRANAAITITQNSESTIVDNLIGQYTVAYTGDVNFFGFGGVWGNKVINELKSGSLKSKFADTLDKIGADKIKNSSASKLTKTEGSEGIAKAYLVWETAVQGIDDTTLPQKTANKAIWFAGSTPEGEFSQKVTAKEASVDKREVTKGSIQYTFECMYADVTTQVKKYGYGTYAVINMPYAKSAEFNSSTGTHLGESSSGWQLIVVEKNPEVGMKGISIQAGSHFNFKWVGDTWTAHPMKLGIDLGDLKTKSYVSGASKKENTIKCDTLLVGTTATIADTSDTNGTFSMSIKTGTTEIDTLEPMVYGSYLYDWREGEEKLNNNISSIRGSEDTWEFTGNDSKHPAHGKSTFTIKSSDKNWSTLFVAGICIDVADYDVTQTMKTEVKSAVDANVTGKITVDTNQKNTGYKDGKLVITLDDILSPKTDGTVKFKIHNKGGGDDSTIDIVYKNKTVKKSGVQVAYKNNVFTITGIDNIKNGSYINYSIPCKVKQNSGKDTVKCKQKLTGKLVSQGYASSVSKSHKEITSEDNVLYRVTVKRQKSSIEAVSMKSGKTSADKNIDVVNGSANDEGSYYTCSYDVQNNWFISAKPKLKTGCTEVIWNHEIGGEDNGQAGSKYVNSSTKAYERKINGKNLVLTVKSANDNKVTITYHTNYPTGTGDTEKTFEMAKGSTHIIKEYNDADIRFSCTGYTPKRYWTDKNGNKIAGVGDSKKMDNDLHVYGAWDTETPGPGPNPDPDTTETEEEEIKYTVIYDGNGNWNTEQGEYTQELTYGKTETLIPNRFSRNGGSSGSWCEYDLPTGYEFVGWSESADSQTAEYTDMQTAEFNMTEENGGTIRLYAIWKKDVTLTLDYNTGYFDGNGQVKITKTMYNREYETEIDIEEYYGQVIENGLNSRAQKTGEYNIRYRFLGWTEQQTVENLDEQYCVYNQYRSNGYTIHEDAVIYAQWESILCINAVLDKNLNGYTTSTYNDAVTQNNKDVKVLSSDNMKYIAEILGKADYTELTIEDTLTEVYRLAKADGTYAKYWDDLNNEYMNEAYSLNKHWQMDESVLRNQINGEFYIPQYVVDYQKLKYGGTNISSYIAEIKAVSTKSHYWKYHIGQDEIAKIQVKMWISDSSAPDTDREEHKRLHYSLDYGNN